ncbi:MAG: LacI family DNA-binding transcriptional regulator [Chloroflexi bacterium]|nr:LacI family DNA-binding transcriptional regulator [Chloroflexota bacterium]
MTTIHDVARRAGVASITASRVINNSGYASKAVRERVLEAASAMGYVPNRLASSLRSRRTNVLALVLTDITNPFFTVAARGVEDVANRAGYTVIFCNTDEDKTKEKKYVEILMQNRVDGVVLVPSDSESGSVETLQQNGVPVVVIDRHIPSLSVDQVRCDSIGGAYDLTRLLTSLGHRRIALLNGPQNVSTAADRLTGFRQALQEAGAADPALQVALSGSFTRASGFAMANQAIQLSPRPTAILAGNNFIGLGTLQALEEAGLRVPEDMAVVTFDDLPESLVVTPFLTAAAQPVYEMAARATEILLRRLANSAETAFEEVVFPTRLILRKSSGAGLSV